MIRAISKALLILLFPAIAQAAITCTPLAEDIYASTSISSRAVSVNIGTPTNGLLVVSAMSRAVGNPYISSATWNGVDMRKGHTAISAGSLGSSIYGLENPASGTHDVGVYWSVATGQFHISIMVCDGALQTSSVIDVSTGAAAASGIPSSTMTTTADGDLIVAHLSTEHNSVVANPDSFTTIQDHDFGNFVSQSAYYVQPSAGSIGVNFGTTTEGWVMSVTSFKAAVASGGTDPPRRRRIIIAQ